jgi:hypothetical protein
MLGKETAFREDKKLPQCLVQTQRSLWMKSECECIDPCDGSERIGHNKRNENFILLGLDGSSGKNTESQDD